MKNLNLKNFSILKQANCVQIYEDGSVLIGSDLIETAHSSFVHTTKYQASDKLIKKILSRAMLLLRKAEKILAPTDMFINEKNRW